MRWATALIKAKDAEKDTMRDLLKKMMDKHS
jgi:hypothetical protein